MIKTLQPKKLQGFFNESLAKSIHVFEENNSSQKGIFSKNPQFGEIFSLFVRLISETTKKE